MKKLFTLATLLVAFVGVANAQNYFLQVNRTDSVTKQFNVEDLVNVRFGDDLWQEWGVGTYTYHTIWHSWWEDDDYVYEEPVEKANLKIYRSTFNPKRFKIANWNYKSYNEGYDTFMWDYDVDFYFLYDEETGEVKAEETQCTGAWSIFTGTYVYVEEAIDNCLTYGSWDYNNPEDAPKLDAVPRSYRDGDTFYFSLLYYTLDMEMLWGYADQGIDDYEMLTITSYTEDGSVDGEMVHTMELNHKDGTYTQYSTENLANVTLERDPWTDVALGNYRFQNIYFLGAESNVYICSHYADESQWALRNWVKDLTDGYVYFSLDKDTGQIYVTNKNTGYDEALAQVADGSTYEGDLWMCEASYLNWMLTGEDEDSYPYHSYYDADEGVYYFAVGYYMWIGDNDIINFGYTGYTNALSGEEPFGYETYTPTIWDLAPWKKR